MFLKVVERFNSNGRKGSAAAADLATEQLTLEGRLGLMHDLVGQIRINALLGRAD